MNQYLHRIIGELHDFDSLDFSDKNADIPLKQDLPDGAFRIYEANDKVFDYKFQINDNRYLQYHRNNGVTKIGVYKPDSKDKATEYMGFTVEGQINVADIAN